MEHREGLKVSFREPRESPILSQKEAILSHTCKPSPIELQVITYRMSYEGPTEPYQDLDYPTDNCM